MRLRIGSPLAAELTPGDSLAVNGVCLTVIRAHGRGDSCRRRPGDTPRHDARHAAGGALVNLERPLRADSRFGGHFVQGHVDAVGDVEELRADADFHWLTVELSDRTSRRFIVPKGSIAIDGISLTVAGLGADRVDIMVLPYTLQHTNVRGLKAGDRVNLECDMIGKYVVRAAELAGLTLTPANAGDVTH